MKKIAYSDFIIAKGKLPLDSYEGNPVNRKYHYMFHGKYGTPGMNLPDSKVRKVKTEYISKDKHSPGKTFVAPEKVDKYIAAYDADFKTKLKKHLSGNWEVKNRDRSLVDKVMGRNKTKTIPNPTYKEYKEEAPELIKHHKKTLDLLRKYKSTGFTTYTN